MSNLLTELSPVEKRGGLWFKRDDLFAPFGEGGVNGSKLRQLIWLVGKAQEQGYKGIIAGAVAGSPQHVMMARVANYFGMKCAVLSGVKNPQKSPMLALAVKYGAEYVPYQCGYAAALQSKAFKLQKTEKYKDYFVVETNITVLEKFNSLERIRDFHSVGAMQVQNIPDEVDTLILPAGSCNSAVSVLYGLYLYPKPNIKTIYLMGIGSLGSRDIEYVFRRLGGFCPEAVDKTITFEYRNLNGTGFCKYNDLMECSYEGIVFHPRYESKIFTYAKEKGLLETWKSSNSLFWIVGSEPLI